MTLHGSDKLAAADNQQERLIKIGWITGFVDGEGCFSIHFVRQPHRQKRRGYTTGFQVGHEFAVVQSARSVECLYMLKRFFGVGEVYLNRRFDNHKEHLYRFSVVRRVDLLQVVIPFFQMHPLRTSKKNDFSNFVKCMRMIEANAHLTVSGLLAIVELAQTMNHRKPRTEMIRILRDYTPNTDDHVGEDIVPSAWRHAGRVESLPGFRKKIKDLYQSEIPCRVSNIARGGGNTAPNNRLKSVEP
jgi:LAGLIDADG endonuclease